MSARTIGPASAWRRRGAAAVVATVLVALGLIGATASLDAPSDGSIVDLGWRTWRLDGVVVAVPGGDSGGLRSGDLVTAVAGHRLSDGLGGVARPSAGSSLRYDIARDAPAMLEVPIRQVDPYPLLVRGWGDLVFVLAFGALALALFVRRPEEPSTGPLLVAGAGLLGSTLAVVAGLPALALVTAGPQLYLFHLNVVGAYSVAWGAVLAFFVTLTPGHPWLRRGRRLVPVAYIAPLAVMACWSAVAALLAPDAIRWLGLIHAGQSVVVALTLVVSIVAVSVAYHADREPVTRARVRWLAGGGALAALISIAGWHLPAVLVGQPALPQEALGLAGLPFVCGIAVALRRHHLFDIERLVNRSLVYAATVGVLAAGYIALVTVLVSGLRLSDRLGAALAATCAALALSPLRNAAQVAVDRVMYGDRHDPAAALARLGARLRAVMLPAEVPPAVVDTVARSMRLPYAALEIEDAAGGFHLAAQHGQPEGAVHAEPLLHHGSTVGRLLVSDRGRHDPLDAVDLSVIGSLAQQIGAAVQAVRLHADLVRSRAELVALREEERRRMRRDLHDGLGPTLAAIGLKANLAARDVDAGSTAHELLSDIAREVKASLDDVWRLVDSLRPPALDELGLVEAVRSRALALGADMSIDVIGPARDGTLPAAIETAAYRIAVEGVTNAVRHSGGRHCAVAMVRGSEGLEVTVRDDGDGLGATWMAGVGLRSMRERAEEVGGNCSISCPPDGGTLVHAWLPTVAGGES